MNRKRIYVWLMAGFGVLAASFIGLLLSSNERDVPWRLDEITGHMPDLQFSLTADDGKAVTEQNYKGRVTLLYFGFAHCPGVCPMTMARMAAVFKALGKDAAPIQLLFVSVDSNDSPQSLKEFLKPFDSGHMTGLQGPPSAVEALAKRYRAVYQPASGNDPIMHSDTLYIFDAFGHARLLATSSDKEDDIASDLRRLTHDARW